MGNETQVISPHPHPTPRITNLAPVKERKSFLRRYKCSRTLLNVVKGTENFVSIITEEYHFRVNMEELIAKKSRLYVNIARETIYV